MNTYIVYASFVLFPSLLFGAYIWSMAGLLRVFKAQFKGFKHPDGGTVGFVMVGLTVLFLYLFAQLLSAIWASL